MTIREARVEDVDFIVEITGKMLESMNLAFGFDRFKTNGVERRKVVSKRLEESGGKIFYDLLVDDQDIPLGLSNYYIKEDKVGEILMLLSINEKEEEIKALYDSTIGKMEELGIKALYVQIGPHQKSFQRILHDDGFSIPMVHMVKRM